MIKIIKIEVKKPKLVDLLPVLAASVIRFAQKADGWLGIMLHIHHICIISTLGRQIFVRSRPARTPCETLSPKPNQLLLGIKR